MTSIRDQALADILTVVDTDILGVSMTIDGQPVVAVPSELTAEEKAGEGFDGLNDETMLLCLDVSSLPAVPVPQQAVDVDGESWRVVRAPVYGNLLKMLLHRYVT